MKISTALLFLLFFAGHSLYAQTLSGRIIDSASQRPLEGVTVYLPQLQLGAITNSKGNYTIAPLPKGKYVLKVQSIGYAGVTEQIVVEGDRVLDFRMSHSSAGLQEVIISSLGYSTTQRRAPIPVTVVSHDMFLQQASTNVIDAISRQPGITEITEGPGISKPEINGLGYNRVLTLFDGERQEDFQWGDEHGILIDPYAVHHAEIIRGPASLQYGANAVAGVISFTSESLPENGITRGSVQSEYQTNNGLIGNSLNLRGNKQGLAWDIRGSYEAAHCYWDPHDGYVWGTAFTQSNWRATVTLNKSWGVSRLSVSLLNRRIEVPDGNRDSATGKFAFDFPQNGQLYPDKANFLSYKPVIAGDQVLAHDEVWWQNSLIVGTGKLEADIGYTQSIRHEIDTGTVGEYNLIVHDLPFSFAYRITDDRTGWKFTTGVNGMVEFGNNYPEPPAPYIGFAEIPDYHDFDIGGYGILEKNYKQLTLSGGLRYDLRNIVGASSYLINYNTPQQEKVPPGTPGAYQQFAGSSNAFTGWSGSIGASYQLPGNNYWKINFAKSYRAPSIQELNSNALNAGSNAYILGNTNLQAEQGYEMDIAYGMHDKDFHFEVNGFYNYINHFIFQDRLAASQGGDSILQSFPVFQYQANTAIIEGVTATLNLHPADAKWFEMKNGFTYIYSFLPGQTDSTQHLPLTPAPRLTSTCRINLPERNNALFGGTYVEFGAEHDWAQHTIYRELYTELPSFAYTLFNAGIGTHFFNRKTKHPVCSLFLNATNLTNIAYVEHTSHTQYFRAYQAIPVTVTQQSQGIYNMGRNLGLKLIFPFGGNQASEKR